MGEEETKAPDTEAIEASIQYAKKYLEDLLSFFGLNIEVRASNSDDEVIELQVPSTHLNGFLIGSKGETMHGLQFLTSCALKSKEYAINRVNVDIAEYKAQRAERLREKAEEWVKQVRETGEDMSLRPMNASDRRVIHKLAGEHGLTTESEGSGRERHIVLKSSGQPENKPEKKPKEEPEKESSNDDEAS